MISPSTPNVCSINISYQDQFFRSITSPIMSIKTQFIQKLRIYDKNVAIIIIGNLIDFLKIDSINLNVTGQSILILIQNQSL